MVPPSGFHARGLRALTRTLTILADDDFHLPDHEGVLPGANSWTLCAQKSVGAQAWRLL